jgi:hypothetical protein
VGCPVTALLSFRGCRELEGPRAGMSAGAAGGIARATKGLRGVGGVLNSGF